MNLVHVTKAGERWDMIAWQYYRDVRQAVRLMEANPRAPATAALPSGLRLSIPMIEAAAAVGLNGLPPWRR